MAVWFMDSFDGNDSTTGKWSAITGSWTVGAPARTGINGVAHPIATANAQLARICAAAEESATMIAGFAWRTSSILATDGYGDVFIVQFRGDANTTRHVSFTLLGDGSLRARRGGGDGTILGTTAAGVIAAADTWYFLEFKVLLSDTVGAVDIRVNGASVLSLTGQDTKNAGTDTVFDSIALGRSGFGQWNSDDLYFGNNLGGVNDDFLGDSIVEMRFPDADGTVQWDPSTGTSHYVLVDEATPSSADYVGDEVVDSKDMFSVQSVTDPNYVIWAVQTSAFAAKTDAGARSYGIRVESDASSDQSSDLTLSTSYATSLHMTQQNPDGPATWTPATVDAASFGVVCRP